MQTEEEPTLEQIVHEIAESFDETWWKRRVNAGIVQMELKGRCVVHKGWNWVPFKKTRGRTDNGKKKTIRTHRDGRSRR